MTDENAALEDDQIVTLDENQETDDLNPIEEPAPSPADTPAGPDKVQERINKVVGQKHQAIREKDEAVKRAAELEAQLQTQTPVKSDGAPKLEDFDYDDAAFNAASIKYEVQKAKDEIKQEQEQTAVQDRQRETQAKWNDQVAKVTEEDYQETVALIPVLPLDTLNALMQAEAGPRIAYYLGKHLDVADEISRMTPTMAAMRLGEISARLSNANPSNKPSAAPDPVEPLKPGGTTPGERGPAGARYE